MFRLVVEWEVEVVGGRLGREPKEAAAGFPERKRSAGEAFLRAGCW